MHFVNNFFEGHPTKGYFLPPSATECRPIRGQAQIASDRVQLGESVPERGTRDVPRAHRARVAGMPVRGLSSRDRSRTAGAAARE